MAERNWFAPERSVPGMWDTTAAMNGLWTCFLFSELAASLASGRKVYNLRQTINNLASWLLTTLYVALVKGVNVFPYVWVYERYGLVRYGPHGSWAVHVVALLYADFIFYWGHRLAHTCNLMWSTHVVHHSAPDFNYSTGFRAGFLEHTLPFMFWLPLALVCPPQAYYLHKAANQVLMFWAHTEMVGKLWWPVELLLVTPSHHRVHHARNYGRKNFGGLFIVWDRLFGTFQEERAGRKPLYGLNAQTVVQGTYNPVWHQVHHLLATFRLAFSGRVSLYTALYTRTTGPDMIHPATTDALPGSGDDSAAEDAGGKGGGRAWVPPAARLDRAAAAGARSGGGEAARQAKWQGRAAGGAIRIGARAGGRRAEPAEAGAGLPWEARPLGLLDCYAAAQFFLAVIPAFAAFIAALPDLPPPLIFGGAAFALWTVTATAWLCGGEAKAARFELARVGMQAAAAAYLLHVAALPAAGGLLARAVLGWSAAGAACLLAAPRVDQTVQADKRKKAA